jgi:Fibronectin type 3 domain-containing protein
MMPLGSTAMFNNVDPQGNPTNPIVNQLVNFGWEYTYHCHILSHEEMDMMRPVTLALPPIAPTGLVGVSTGSGSGRRLVLSWNDNSITETEFVIQSLTWPNTWTDVGRVLSPLGSPNTHQLRTFTVPGTYNPSLAYSYRIVAQNTVGYGLEFPTMTAKSFSNVIALGTVPLAPTNLTATLQSGPQVRLTWRDNATNESGFVIERSTDGVNFTQIGTAPARSNTGNVTFTDTTLKAAQTTAAYTYQVKAANVAGPSLPTNTVSVVVGVVAIPVAPTTLTATLQAGPLVQLTWTDNAVNETGFRIERSTNGTAGPFTLLATASPLATTGTVTFNDTAVPPTAMDVTYTYRVAAVNVGGTSAFTNTASVTEPALPAAPSSFGVVNGPNKNKARSVILTWADNSLIETGFTVQRATNVLFTQGLTTVTVGADVTTLTQTSLTPNTQYWFRIRANNGTIVFTTWVNATPLPITTNP